MAQVMEPDRLQPGPPAGRQEVVAHIGIVEHRAPRGREQPALVLPSLVSGSPTFWRSSQVIG